MMEMLNERREDDFERAAVSVGVELDTSRRFLKLASAFCAIETLRKLVDVSLASTSPKSSLVVEAVAAKLARDG